MYILDTLNIIKHQPMFFHNIIFTQEIILEGFIYERSNYSFITYCLGEVQRSQTRTRSVIKIFLWLFF